MKILKTFRFGGIHPGADKLTAGMAIRVLPLPATVILPVIQHSGAPAIVKVAVGDRVKTGSLVAEISGVVSANIHASISGVVTKIEETPDVSGYRVLSIEITREGDEWLESISAEPVIREFTPEEIIQKVKDAGIVGMGGAGFPTHVKLGIPTGMKVDTLLINGIECEPYLTADHQLMLEKGEEILSGTRLLMSVLGADRAIIGIEVNKPDAILLLNNLSKKYEGIQIEALAMKYPQGSEKQLIHALTGRQVPPGSIPASVGVLVNNVATTFAVYEAVYKNKPLIDRVVTVTGKSVKLPGNFLVRIGTPVSELIGAAGGLPTNTGKVVVGGPMMGKAVSNLHFPVTKGMSGIVMVPESEASRQDDLPCIRCAKCVEGCPMKLEPYLLMQLSEKGLWDLAEISNVTDCMECGSCSFTCPSARPILDNIRIGKSMVNKNRAARLKKIAKS